MRCIIISGSPECDIDFLKSQIKNDDFIICADKGYSYAKLAGIMPDIAVGDFDSCADTLPDYIEVVRLDVHKDDTDTMHCIDVAISKGYTEFVILAALGGRLDHTYANVSALQYIATKGGRGVLLSENEQVEFLPVGRYEYKNLFGHTFSLFPFACQKVLVSYIGAEYSLNKSYLNSNYPMGVSNKFISNDSVVEIYDGNAIIVINLKTV